MANSKLTPERLYQLSDPVIFGEYVLERDPYPAQANVLRCPHPDQVDTMGRGVGKSKVLLGDKVARRASVLPYLAAMVNRLTKPLEYLAVLISKTKEQAFELQTAIRNSFDRNQWLRSTLSPDSTKTNLLLIDENGIYGRILLRPATDAARGLHAETRKIKGEVWKGLLDRYLDEGWFLKDPNFIEEVLGPMGNMAGPGSQSVITTTPKGKIGPVWAKYDSPMTGRCAQWFVRDEFGRRIYDFVDDGQRAVWNGFGIVPEERRKKDAVVGFDLKKCHECMFKFSSVVHNFPSWENPYQDLRVLLQKRRELVNSGRGAIWTQEYEGVPQSTAGLFFNSRHHELMWNDNLPEYRVNELGELKVLRSTAIGAIEDDTPPRSFFPRSAKFYLGYDASQGIVSTRVDYSATAIVMELNGKGTLVYCQRFKEPLPYFRGKHYEKNQLVEFMDDLNMYLFEIFGCDHAWVDQGFGQSTFAKFLRAKGATAIDYIPTSRKAKVDGFMNMRGLVEALLFQMPVIGWLETETEYLAVEQDALEDDQVKIHKAKSWGATGAQVDGLNAVANACMGLKELGVQVSVGQAVGQTTLPGVDLRRATVLGGEMRKPTSYLERMARG